MNEADLKYLKLLDNANGNTTVEQFLCDIEPIGDLVWPRISHLVIESENGKARVSDVGKRLIYLGKHDL